MTAVRFIRDHDRYMRGEVAGFRPAEAERLVRRKVAPNMGSLALGQR
jgi:hypothetical protein